MFPDFTQHTSFHDLSPNIGGTFPIPYGYRLVPQIYVSEHYSHSIFA